MQTNAELHSDQIDYWNGAGGSRWVQRQAATDVMLAPFADLLLAESGLQAGDAVVDLGCGCGATTAAVAARVGEAGRVLGLDVSAPMLAQTRERLSAFSNATCVCADAASHAVEPPADHVVSRFGVMFFGDPAAAFANVRRWLKPGGRLTFMCWRPIQENPWMQVPLHAAYTHVPRLPKPDPEAPGPFSFADPARVRRILSQAGFAAPAIRPFDRKVDLACGRGLPDAVRNAMTIGATSRAVQDQPDDVQRRVADAIGEALAPFVSGAEVPLDAAVWVVTTQRD
jgi:SAM-dependent methyltransferase